MFEWFTLGLAIVNCVVGAYLVRTHRKQEEWHNQLQWEHIAMQNKKRELRLVAENVDLKIEKLEKLKKEEK